ncbi:MAG: UDP-N-acetylglucosamine 1-carboxyvinyltransferase [Eubacteriales bacterium]|nr:UDP-N-acetylglucosamine 1-carboxyvinyltransferase [Eubacteriales bacterium]
MDAIWIEGNRTLSGEVTVQGSKNAALPVLAATLLVPGVTRLLNCPEISDVSCMCEILRHMGARVERRGKEVTVDASELTGCRILPEHAVRMRSSVILAGALLGRCREAFFFQPGGCVIGDRPIDMHLWALGRLGVFFSGREGEIRAQALRLRGAFVRLPFPSVGVTQNAVLAAVGAEGTTRLTNCAREPEIGALCRFLRGAGADVREEGGGEIRVEGGRPLHASTFWIDADRIVAGTYLAGVLAAGGKAFLRQAPWYELKAALKAARRMGAVVRTESHGLYVERTGRLLSPGELVTGVYPAFPTDLQSPFLAAMCLAEGKSSIRERIFNGRFGVAGQLNRMGADIRIGGDRAFVPGGRRLSGCRVAAGELRGGAALTVAGLCAQGRTVVENCHFIRRGYEDIVRDLKELGADIGNETEVPPDEGRQV